MMNLSLRRIKTIADVYCWDYTALNPALQYFSISQFPFTMFATTSVMVTVKTITRKELIHEGANTYLVRLLTHNLHPIRIDERTNIYRLSDVIATVRHHLNHPRTKPQTCDVLEVLLERLILRLDNVIRAPFGKSLDEQIGFHIDRILGKETQD